MQTLRSQAPEVPRHVWVLHVGLGVALLGVDERWELRGEKDTGQWKFFYILIHGEVYKNTVQLFADTFAAAIIRLSVVAVVG